MPTSKINGVGLAYQTSGAGDPVVLVHGSWGDHEVWGQLVPLLARHRKVITYDRRGYGASERPLGPRRIRADDVEDLAGLIARVADGPADVVGNSLGALIALRLAALHPELVRSVSAHEPPLFPLLEGASPAARADRAAHDASVASTLDLIGQGRREDAARLFMEAAAFGPGAWEQIPGPLRDIFVFNAPVFRDEQADPDWSCLELAELASMAMPLQLTCGGDAGPALREVVEILAERLPSARQQSIDGAGYVPQITHPHQFAESIEDFWATAGDEERDKLGEDISIEFTEPQLIHARPRTPTCPDEGTAMATGYERETGITSGELLNRVRLKQAEVDKYLGVNLRRRRRLVNLIIIAGALAAVLTAPPAIGGKPFADWLQQVFNSSTPSWQFLCLFASLSALASVIATQIQKSNNYEERIVRAQGLRAKLEVLEVSITSGGLALQKAMDEFFQCLKDSSFMEPTR